MKFGPIFYQSRCAEKHRNKVLHIGAAWQKGWKTLLYSVVACHTVENVTECNMLLFATKNAQSYNIC